MTSWWGFALKQNSYLRFAYRLGGTEHTGRDLKKFPLPIRFDSDYIKGQVEIINSSGSDYVETATPLSRWISTIMQGTSKDFLGLEQTVKLGDFGGITLLTFQN